jgi:hypothetical protein
MELHKASALSLNRLISQSIFFFISTGAIQLLVGPASSFKRLQIKVLSSTRATSLGSLKQAKLFGRFSGFNCIKVPFLLRVYRDYHILPGSHRTNK